MSFGDLNREDIVRLIRKGRAAEQRGEAVKGCITAFMTAVFVVSLDAWLAMLLVGVIHDLWAPGLRTIGFWTALLLILLLRAVMPGVFVHHRVAKKGGAS